MRREETAGYLALRRRKTWLHFLFHLLSYLPTLLVAGWALIGNVAIEHIKYFLLFTSATVALEVCITCFRMKVRICSRIERYVAKEDNPVIRAEYFYALRHAQIKLGFCVTFVIAVIISWLIITRFEVTHMQGVHLTETEEFLIYCLTSLSVTLSLIKMWDHAKHLGKEDFPSSSVVRMSAGREVVAGRVPVKKKG